MLHLPDKRTVTDTQEPHDRILFARLLAPKPYLVTFLTALTLNLVNFA